MRPARYVALGDSLTLGIGDPVSGGWRGWAALLAPSLADGPVEFTNLAASGALTRDVLERQTPHALDLRPDLVSVVVGVNDTLRQSFDIRAVARRLDQAYAAFARQGATVLTACLPDPGAMLGLPGPLARPLARRQRAVNAVVHALSVRHGALHTHACEGAWVTDRTMWSADRLHPGERGHRELALRAHTVLAEAGVATGPAPSPEPEQLPPTTAASLWWLATAGTGWVARRCTDLLPQLLALAAAEIRHGTRGDGRRLDLRSAATVTAALAELPARSAPPAAPPTPDGPSVTAGPSDSPLPALPVLRAVAPSPPADTAPATAEEPARAESALPEAEWAAP